MPDISFARFSPGGRLLPLLSFLVFALAFPLTSYASSLSDRLGISLFDAREKAPEIRAPDLSGRLLHLSDYRGKVVLLNFWATWCDPCKKEIPSLIALQKKLAGRPFVVVSVAMDRQIVHIPPFVRKFGIDYPVLEGRKGEVDSRYFGLGLPQSYVILPDGTLVGRVVGGRDWSSRGFVDYFRSLAEKNSGGGTSQSARGNL